MKIKRFKNLWLMGLILSGAMLGAIYLAKIISPQFVIEVAQVDSIVKIGHYIDTQKWAWYVANTIISIFIYYFYCGACCEKKTFDIKDWAFILGSIVLGFLSKEFIPTYYTTLNYISLILVPFLMNGKFKNTAISFTAINLLQVMTLEIRNIGLMVADYNTATMLILMIDYYILEVLLFMLFNYKNGKENS